MKELKNKQEIIQELNRNNIGIIPTDTIYGIVSKINNKPGIKKIFKLKKRDENKKFPVLFSNFSQIENLTTINSEIVNFWKLAKLPVTILLPFKKNSEIKGLEINNKIALRLVKSLWLKEIIDNVGPIVATSVNKSGEDSILTPTKIKNWSKKVDFYCLQKSPSMTSSGIFDWATKSWLRKLQ